MAPSVSAPSLKPIATRDTITRLHQSRNVRVVAGLDFGSAYSGFASAYVNRNQQQQSEGNAAADRLEGFYDWA